MTDDEAKHIRAAVAAAEAKLLDILAANMEKIRLDERSRCVAVCRRIQAEADADHAASADPGAGADGAGRAADEIEGVAATPPEGGAA